MHSGFRFLQVDNDPGLLQKTYRLRYEIYCRETRFLNAAEYPDRMESDSYDLPGRSLHFAAIDSEGYLAGSIRLILGSDQPFPIEAMGQEISANTENIPRTNIAEISRLVINKNKRRRPEDGLFGVESYLPESEGGVLGKSRQLAPEQRKIQERRRQPAIILGLYKAMYQASKKMGLTHWYAAMEKKLWYALNRFAFPFTPIGPEIDYYGPVIPYLGIIRDIENIAQQKKPEMFAFMMEGLARKHQPAQPKPTCNKSNRISFLATAWKMVYSEA